MSYLAFALEMLGNMFKPPVTTDYPIKPRTPVEGDRGKVVIDISKCIFCGSCQRNCPADAITVNRAKGTWEINPFSCVQCRGCVDNCPKKCLSMDPMYTAPATEKANILVQGTPPPIPQRPIVAKPPVAKPAVAAEASAPVVPVKAAEPKIEAPAVKAETPVAAEVPSKEQIMHELPITEQIVKICTQTAAKYNATVKTIELVVGEDSGFIGESIQMYFDVIGKGTVCEGAKLHITGVKPKLKCFACGEYFDRKPFSFTCPFCGGEGGPTEIGKEFYIKSVELDVPDEEQKEGSLEGYAATEEAESSSV